MNSLSAVAAPLLVMLMMASVAEGVRYTRQAGNAQSKSPEAEFMTAEELKAKIAKNEPVTVIDVRATDAYLDSDNKIKGAIHVKLRRLRNRLSFAPLKDIPHDREIVTYCACSSDQASIRAAKILSAAGFTRARVLKGGWQEWLKISGHVEKRPKA